MEKPTVHLNGTSASALIEQCCNVVNAIRDARNALAEASPNARDYYMQSPDAFRRARIEHDVRDSWLKTIADEMMEIAEHVADARDGRVTSCARCGFENPMEGHDRLCPKRTL